MRPWVPLIALTCCLSGCDRLLEIEKPIPIGAGGAKGQSSASTASSDGGGGNSASPTSDASTGTGVLVCPADMVLIPASQGFAAYCIDATEVTRSGYNEFRSQAAPSALKGPHCMWNQSFLADGLDSGCLGESFGTNTDLPMTCVDWCDSLAYCQWRGKHLCHKRDGTSLYDANAHVLATDGTLNEWQHACNPD